MFHVQNAKVFKVNEARMAIFEKKYAPNKTSSHPLNKLKGANPSDMPPCRMSLINKVRRANYIAYLGKNAISSSPSDLDITEHGWLLKNNQYAVKWYEGEQLPESVASILCKEDTCTSMDDLEDEQGTWSSDESDGGDDMNDDHDDEN